MTLDIKMAIIRPIGSPISQNFYNCQEIGLARGLSKCGICVDVYVAGKSSEVVCKNIDSSGDGLVRLFEVPFIKVPEIDHALYPKLVKLLNEGRYDFIQVNEENELTSFLVAKYARQHGIPVVIYQGMYEQITGRIRATFQKCYDKLLLPTLRRNISMALVKTSRAQKHLERKGFQNIMIVPVGLDPTPFLTSKDRNWRSELLIPAESQIILYVGIFERRRNVDFMLNLANTLAGDGVTLVMAGLGPEYERIKTRIGEEKLNNVRLVGAVSQEYLPSLYLESTLFLLPSKYEIYGMVVLEAMYFGVPVLSTRTAGPDDIIKSGIDGFLFDNLDENKWASAVREVIQSPVKREEMSFAAKKKVQRELTWDAVSHCYATSVIEPICLGNSVDGLKNTSAK